VDGFIRARLAKEGLTPNPLADKRTLIRRVSFDLIGLPPTPEEVEAFVRDTSPGAYEKVVDRLLASPHYGERMALGWLDLARYADTHGYHIDSHRDMYRWRDWVIAAFNRNLPYDQFITEQIAGDLLPNATLDQRIATGFNRNHPINFEGGAIPEEYAMAYVADRVDTTSTALLGLTMRCAQCHDHKYDPITQKEYYQLFAYFNNIDEAGLDGTRGNARPFVTAPYPEQEQRLAEIKAERERVDAQITAREATFTTPVNAFDEKTLRDGLAFRVMLATQPEGATVIGKPTFGAGHVSGAVTVDGSSAIDLGTRGDVEKDVAFSYGCWVEAQAGTYTLFSKMDAKNGVRGWDLFLVDGKPYAHFIHNWPSDALRVDGQEAIPIGKWTHVFVTYDGTGGKEGVKIYVNGRPIATRSEHNTLKGTIRTNTPFRIGGRYPDAGGKAKLDDIRFYDRTLSAEEIAWLVETDPLRPLIALPVDKRTPDQAKTLIRFTLQQSDAGYRALVERQQALMREGDALQKSLPTTMVMQEKAGEPRKTFLLDRGQYDKPKDEVKASVPSALGLPAPAGVNNRLQLARWLVDERNPLTARVAVNRFWQHFFGVGLVKTSENFGIQGERPSHPELLDWLSWTFVQEDKWDMRRLIKRIVLSETYRQSASATPEQRRRDPENRLLARAPRTRLPAELLRDSALAVSGLLVPKIGGPSVKPYHPAGLWEEMSFKGEFTAQVYEQDHGEALYRRSLYTFWKRTVPPPSLQTFDAPEREFCVIRRPATNTPLQALVLMNDPTYAEASRKVAERLLKEAPPSPVARIDRLCRLLLARPATASETRALLTVYNAQYRTLLRTPGLAQKRLSVGESPVGKHSDPNELAAWALVVSVVLNLDEAITRG
jgi:hypothetical protein